MEIHTVAGWAMTPSRRAIFTGAVLLLCSAAPALADLCKATPTEAGVSPNTLTVLERGGTVRPETEAKMRYAFAAHSVEMTNGDGTGARLRKAGAQ